MLIEFAGICGIQIGVSQAAQGVVLILNVGAAAMPDPRILYILDQVSRAGILLEHSVFFPQINATAAKASTAAQRGLRGGLC
ncbi:MAG TPA: hypothetical protein VH280_12480 [Verrucomicrobiae bacterium]|jgi:hypothetical protein|nr:hypothetical protein [Verrucomicrobiae bacterium]